MADRPWVEGAHQAFKLHGRAAPVDARFVFVQFVGVGGQAVVLHVALQGEAQDDSLATYAHKLNKDEARIDWSRPAVELERLVRAFNPWPICHSTLNGEALKVLAATLAEGSGAPGEIIGASKEGLLVACGEQALCLTRLQLPGGKALNFSDLFNSRREKFAPGIILGVDA